MKVFIKLISNLIFSPPKGGLPLDKYFVFIIKSILIIPGGINGYPLQRSCLENPRDGGAWWAAIYRVAQSRTRLK